jgi:two-component system chemotaxis sensor kinase CheA
MHLTDEMVNVFLEAGDVIRMQLDAHRGEGDVDEASVKIVCDKLARLTGSADHHESVAAPAPVVEEDYGFFDDEPVAAVTDDAGYGFFDDEPVAAVTADEGYGFFDDEPVAPSSGDASVDQGYGFFDEIVDAASVDEASVDVAPVQPYGFFPGQPGAPAADYDFINEVVARSDAPGYGFFVDEPTQFPSTPQQAQQEAQQGYGFFKKITPVAAAPVAEVAPVVETPNRRSSDKAPVAETSIRVNVEKVDQLINLVGELVITQAMLADSATGIEGALSERLEAGLRQLERNTRDLQEVIMSVRMLPISFVFSRFPRVVRDLAAKLGKQIELKTLGEGTELDKGLIEKIADPLTHLVRNSLDHGIESPEKRLEAGKSAKGTITLKASHQGGNIVIEVSDDGGGLNRAKILAKAKERGLPVRDDITDSEICMLIFEAGFSTADVVSDVSGRGVGMDVVKRNIAAMGGRVDIESVEGMGTRILIRLPLTLAILDGLSVAVGEQTYIIPLAYIIESLQMSESDLRTISGGSRLVQVRGEYLPVVPLHEVFSLPRKSDAESNIVVIVEADGKKIALLVDDLIGQHQVVIKSLESNFRRLPGISGATIMGNGQVALILDVAAISLTPAHHNRLEE